MLRSIVSCTRRNACRCVRDPHIDPISKCHKARRNQKGNNVESNTREGTTASRPHQRTMPFSSPFSGATADTGQTDTTAGDRISTRFHFTAGLQDLDYNVLFRSRCKKQGRGEHSEFMSENIKDQRPATNQTLSKLEKSELTKSTTSYGSQLVVSSLNPVM